MCAILIITLYAHNSSISLNYFTQLLFGIISFVIEKTRISQVAGTSMVNMQGSMLATEAPRAYTTLTDIPLLPPAALNSIHSLAFTTVDGTYHTYSVTGISLNPKNKGESLVPCCHHSS